MIDPSLPECSPSAATPRVLRQFGGLGCLVFGALALWQGFGRDHLVWATIWGVLAVGFCVAALVRPRLLGPVFAGATAVTHPIGWLVSQVLLACLYFGVFTPIAFLFRLIGRDALERCYNTDAPTYWAPKMQPSDMSRYFRPS
jgi:hypothetical protein